MPDFAFCFYYNHFAFMLLHLEQLAEILNLHCVININRALKFYKTQWILNINVTHWFLLLKNLSNVLGKILFTDQDFNLKCINYKLKQKQKKKMPKKRQSLKCFGENTIYWPRF